MGKPKRRRTVYYAVSDHPRRPAGRSVYPVIRIGGSFLREYGFEIGDTVEVEYAPGRITIAKQEDNHHADRRLEGVDAGPESGGDAAQP